MHVIKVPEFDLASACCSPCTDCERRVKSHFTSTPIFNQYILYSYSFTGTRLRFFPTKSSPLMMRKPQRNKKKSDLIKLPQQTCINFPLHWENAQETAKKVPLPATNLSPLKVECHHPPCPTAYLVHVE